MEERDIRLACLKLAHERSGAAAEVIEDARKFAAFVLDEPFRKPGAKLAEFIYAPFNRTGLAEKAPTRWRNILRFLGGRDA